MAHSGFIEPPPGIFGAPAAPRSPVAVPQRPEPLRPEPQHMPSAPQPAAAQPASIRPAAAQPAPRAVEPSSCELGYDAARGELPPFPRFDPERLPAPRGGARVVDAGAEAPRRWVLGLPDGTFFPLDAPVVLGRNPAAEHFPHIAVRALSDPTRTMSKTHARFLVEGGALFVDDLNSTNGVAVLPGGELARATAVEPGRPAEVRAGDVVQLGEYPISARVQ